MNTMSSEKKILVFVVFLWYNVDGNHIIIDIKSEFIIFFFI